MSERLHPFSPVAQTEWCWLEVTNFCAWCTPLLSYLAYLERRTPVVPSATRPFAKHVIATALAVKTTASVSRRRIRPMTSSPADASANATSAAKDVTDAKPDSGIGESTIPMAAKRAGGYTKMFVSSCHLFMSPFLSHAPTGRDFIHWVFFVFLFVFFLFFYHLVAEFVMPPSHLIHYVFKFNGVK